MTTLQIHRSLKYSKLVEALKACGFRYYYESLGKSEWRKKLGGGKSLHLILTYKPTSVRFSIHLDRKYPFHQASRISKKELRKIVTEVLKEYERRERVD